MKSGSCLFSVLSSSSLSALASIYGMITHMRLDAKTVHSLLLIMLRPVARLCLRTGFGIQDFLESAKTAFVLTAQEQLVQEGAKVNISRISVATGLHRRDVDRIISHETLPVESDSAVRKVLTAWENQRDWRTASGSPRVLEIDGSPQSFYALVREVTSDVHPSSILSQVERMGVVKRTPHGLKLIAPGHEITRDIGRGYEILARDVDDLSLSVEQNLLLQPRVPNLHARTEFDNVYEESLSSVQDWLLDEGALFHQKARSMLSEHDGDIRPQPGKTAGCKVIVSCFARVERSKKPSGF